MLIGPRQDDIITALHHSATHYVGPYLGREGLADKEQRGKTRAAYNQSPPGKTCFSLARLTSKFHPACSTAANNNNPRAVSGIDIPDFNLVKFLAAPAISMATSLSHLEQRYSCPN